LFEGRSPAKETPNENENVMYREREVHQIFSASITRGEKKERRRRQRWLHMRRGERTLPQRSEAKNNLQKGKARKKKEVPVGMTKHHLGGKEVWG